jgi:PAS domain S-box-containing protein
VSRQEETVALRDAAEARLNAAPLTSPAPCLPCAAGPDGDLQRLVHELQVHKIELELQNETLRQAQIALEESRDRYADLYEFAPVGYLTLSAEGRIADINLSGSILLGMERGKLLQRSFERFIVAEDTARWGQTLARVLQQEEKLECEVVLQRGDGRRFNVRLHCLRMASEGQAPTLRVVLTDITRLKAAEHELHQAQRIARIGNWYWDAATDAMSASDELCRIFGRAALPPLAAQRGTLYAVEAWQELDKAVREAVRSAVGFDLELPALHDDGTSLWINIRSDPARDASGKVVGLRGTLQDITARKQAELELRLSRQLLELTMQLSHTGGWDLDLVDQTSHRTPGHDRIFGYDAPLPAWSHEIFLEHVLAEDRAEADRLFREAVATQGDWNFECRIQRRDGAVRWILAAGGHQRDDKGRVRRMSGIVRDITEAKRLDRALQENNRELERARCVAEKANLAKTDFLSSMSHELRTPLNSILGFAQLMESGTPPPTASQQRDLDRILNAGWYLLELINEILDLSLIESGKAMLTLEPVPMNDVMLECRSMVEPQAERRGITLNFPQCRIQCCIHADRIRVKQVLINLVFNAVKYNRTGGRVDVECSSQSPDCIRINVRDSGEGMVPEQIAQLFQPFNRLGKEANGEEGTGIGLVVSKRLVELMGGRIGVESTAGVGSVFWIELPRVSAPPVAAPRALPVVPVAQPVASGTPQRTVLCVEDNPANLELVEQLVARRPDLRLLTAADGKLGIEFALAYQPQVILMDVSLPDMSGLEVMQVLRAAPSTANIPIIALSANAIPADVAKGMAAGFYRYITKPIRIDEFMEALDTALRFSARSADGKPENIG